MTLLRLEIYQSQERKLFKIISTHRELTRLFESGESPKRIVEKTLSKEMGSYLYGGKTSEAQQTSTPLVVLAKPGAYQMVCNEEACYILVPHGKGAVLPQSHKKVPSPVVPSLPTGGGTAVPKQSEKGSNSQKKY